MPGENCFEKRREGTALKRTSEIHFTPAFFFRIHRENNQVRLNGTVWWQDNQTVSLDIFGDYAFLKKKSQEDEDYSDFDLLLRLDIPDLWVEFRASLISTVDEVKPMSAEFKHKQNNNCFDTIVHLKVRKKLSSIEFFFQSEIENLQIGKQFSGTNQSINQY